MPMTYAELQAHVITNAFEDHNFRARLLADPKAAIRDLTGASIPDSIHVHVHQETATTFHLVLPPSA